MPNKIIVKDHKYYFKIRGLGGPKGDKGDTGPAGPQGPQGPYVNVVAGTTTTLPAGSSAQATVNNTGNTSVLNFGIPQGTKGDKGDAGTPGAQGPRGFAATVNVGETTTGQPGTNASVVNAGNEHDAVLKFTIPRGEKGETGETGPQGPTGGVKSTVVAELPETGESDKYYLVNRTAEGGTIATADGYAQVTNDENGGDLTLDKLYGNAEQTTYSGKNLFHFPLNISTSLYGVAITASANASTFVLNGTSTATSAEVSQAMIGTSNPLELKAGTYTCKITGLKQYTAQAERVYLAPTSAVGTPFVVLKPDNGWTGTFTLASDTDAVMYLILSNQSSHSNTEVALQIESGSTATAYEPYVGGTASPNPDYPQPISTVTGAQTVQVTGKNLVEESIEANIDSSGKIIADNRFCMNIAQVVQGMTYTATEGGHFVAGLFTSKPSINSTSYDGQRIVVLNEHTHTFEAPITGYVAFRSLVDYTGVQLELGSTATAYEPYQGVQQYEINLGKNLIDINSLATTDITVSNGVATGQAQHFYAYYGQNTDGVPFIKKNGQLAISFKAYTDGNASTANTDGLVVRVVYTDGTSAIVIYCKNNETTSVQHTAVTTLGKSVESIQLSYANVGGNIWHISEFQIEEGSQATSYAPYFTPIELAKIPNTDYRDRILYDKTSGKWYIEKQVGKVVLDGTENWALAATYTNCARFVDNDFVVPSTTSPLLCDYFTQGVGGTDAPNIAIHGTQRTVMLTISKTIASTVDAFKAWLASTNSSVYYPLATPTTTEITDETLRAQLNFLASLYEGENNISLVGTGAQGEFTGNYVVYDKYDRHKVYIWSSDDNTWQIIVQ